MLRVSEHEIRHALLDHLIQIHRDIAQTIVTEEFVVRHGAARVDVAVFNGTLEAYEIKSDHDTLTRLDRQVRMYATVFDKLTIVCGLRYRDRILQQVPSWCGVASVQNFTLSFARHPAPNPFQSAIHMIKLLHRSEAAAALRAKRQRVTNSESRRQLYTRLLECVDQEELRALVLFAVKQRAVASRILRDDLHPLEASSAHCPSSFAASSYRICIDRQPRSRGHNTPYAVSTFGLAPDID